MSALDDYERDITDSASQTSAHNVHEETIIPELVTHDVGPPLSHVVSAEVTGQPSFLDIEHVEVKDDPRKWSRGRKTFTLVLVSAAALIATMGINVYNPAIKEIKAQLHATDQQISITLSIFILVQGTTPSLWSAASEIRGRKFVYLTSITLSVIASGAAGAAPTISVLIAMRILQAIGGSAVLTIGAATLADIYDPRERGTMMGVYYAAPLLGPSIAPLIGGVLTQLLNWRATFYFVAIFAGTSLISLLFFRDTYRRERSMLYQTALLRHRRAEANRLADIDKEADTSETKADTLAKKEPESASASVAVVRLSARDLNPITPLWAVLRQRNNHVVLFSSSLLFGFSYVITYTAVLTFAAPPYNFGALDNGLVLLSFGIGSMAGSVLGGRWSDYVLGQIKARNGGRTCPEDRLRSTIPMMPVLPLALVAYAWMAQEKVHIGPICVVLFIAGFSSIWVYSSTLAYIVDGNTGRSSTAVASNSLVRGFAAFVGTEVAVPLQDALGDGGLYTLWAGMMVLSSGVLILVMMKGAQWREHAERRERERRRERKA